MAWHRHGGIIDLVACDRCTRAVRRLLAVMGNGGLLISDAATVPLPTTPAVVVPRRRVQHRPRVLRAAVLLEYAERLLDVDGTAYMVRAAGGPRSDGIWVGWLEFVAVGRRAVRRTGQETTQHSREDLAYWATGLEPVYLQVPSSGRAKRISGAAVQRQMLSVGSGNRRSRSHRVRMRGSASGSPRFGRRSRTTGEIQRRGEVAPAGVGYGAYAPSDPGRHLPGGPASARTDHDQPASSPHCGSIAEPGPVG